MLLTQNIYTKTHKQDWGPSFPGPSIPGRVFLESGFPGFAFLESGLGVHQEFSADGSVSLIFTIKFRRINGMSKMSQPIQVKFHTFGDIYDFVKPDEMNKSYTFKLFRPHLWYPRGSSHFTRPPYLYPFQAILSKTDILKKRIGVRKIIGSFLEKKFHLQVNDELIDFRGTNMIPFDAFSVRVPWEKELLATKVIRTLIQLNTNAIRIWGGGFFPDETMYQACDEEGILIWHDLPWACAVFPSAPTFLKAAREETLSIVFSLQFHPSIVVWGGNNEVEASFDWFDETRLHRRSYEVDYVKLFLGAIKDAVVEAAGRSVIYVDSSPSNGLYGNGSKIWGDVADPTQGDIHFYNYSMDCEDFSQYPRALFVSEHGVQSLPSSLPRYVHDEHLLPAVLQARQRHENGFKQMEVQTRKMFTGIITKPLEGLPYQLRSLLSQIVQGRCLTTAITAWRSYKNNHGIMLWQLNDVWPGVSWSLLEYDLAWKASAYAVQRAFRSIRVSLRRTVDQKSIVIYLQAFHEFTGHMLFGHLNLMEFSWNSTNPSYVFQQLLFKFVFDGSEQEIGRIESPVFGLKVMGLAFVDIHIDLTHSVYVLDEWIEPIGRFHDLESKVTEPLKWIIVGCEIFISPPRVPQPYVWLQSDHLFLHGRGRFDTNGFLLLPFESKRVLAICSHDDDCDCKSLLSDLKIVTLKEMIVYS